MSEVHCGGKKSSKAAAEKFESKEDNFEEAGGDVNQMASPSREGEGHGAIVLPPPQGKRSPSTGTDSAGRSCLLRSVRNPGTKVGGRGSSRWWWEVRRKPSTMLRGIGGTGVWRYRPPVPPGRVGGGRK